MDRSLHVRPPVALPWRGRRAPAALLRLRAPASSLLARRWIRVSLVCVVVAVPLLGGGWLWFRNSGFVAVRTVNVEGVSGPQAHAIEAALRSAGRGMSTLDVNTSALRAAVAQFAVVRGLHASPHFPHGLTISVTEQSPVAALVVGSVRTAVTADGFVLGQAVVSAALPSVSAHWQPLAGQSVHEGGVLAELAVLGAAPRALAARVSSVYTGAHGVTVSMRNGLLVYFGDAARARAKWRALERVLLDEGSAGAAYVDVRTPERPAAGGFPEGVPPPVSSAAGEEGVSSSDPATEASVAALAEGLRQSSPSTASGAPVGANEPAGGASPTSTPSEPQSAAGGQEASSAAPAGGSEAGGEEAAAPSATTEASPSGGATAAPGG